MSAPELTVFPMVPGGLAPFRPAMADVQQITDQVRGDVEKLVQQQYKEFVAVVYQTQVVSGTNYHIKGLRKPQYITSTYVERKVKTDDEAFMLTLVAYKDLSGNVTLLKVEVPESTIEPPIGEKK